MNILLQFMTSDTKCLVTNLRKWKPRGYNWLNNNYRQLFSPAMTFSLQYIETFPFLLWLRGNEMMSWKFKTPARENIASHGKQAIFTKCFSHFYERLVQSFPRCSLWAWVWDSRNKGPVVGRNSDIRNETPGPLVRNESGGRNFGDAETRHPMAKSLPTP